jgi:leader peptidase (prepilin peptidase) / N-methyltransferase
MTLYPLWFPYVVVLAFGLIIGSFLNVCIVRLPHDESVVRPRSRCPRCKTPIAWYHNIPLLSFILLRGRCAGCRAWIGWRYPLVELLTGLFAMATYWLFPAPVPWAIWFILFIAPLLVVTFVDLEHQIIPDQISLGGIPLGLMAQAILAQPGQRWSAVLDGGLGILMGGGFLFVVAVVYEKLRKQEGMGGGDVKLAAMLGAFLGWQAMAFVLLMSAFLGSVVGLIVMVVQRGNLRVAIPYGPFLAGAAILYRFVGEQIVEWYFGHFVG